MERLTMSPLFSYGAQLPRYFENVYLDTTFCFEDYAYFPRRSESAELIMSIIKGLPPESLVYFDCKTLLGFESIFQFVFETFQEKVHVSPDLFKIYTALGLADFCCLNGQNTRFHCCRNRPTSAGLHPCGPERPCVVVRPTAMAHRYLDKWNTRSLAEYTNYSINVPFSMHSSMGEIVKLLTFLRPKRIFPLVIPSSETSPTYLHDLIKLMKPFLRSSPLYLAETTDDIQQVAKKLRVSLSTATTLPLVNDGNLSTADKLAARLKKIEKLMLLFESGQVPHANLYSDG